MRNQRVYGPDHSLGHASQVTGVDGEKKGNWMDEANPCPVCGGNMELENAPYPDGMSLPTLVCTSDICSFSILPNCYENDDLCEHFARRHIAKLLRAVCEGLKAQEVLASCPMFPGDRDEQFMALMNNSVPPVFSEGGNVLKPLPDEDIIRVISALEVK